MASSRSSECQANATTDPPPPPTQVRKQKPNFQRPKNKVTKGVIQKPLHLTKSETPLTNDPLWKDSFILDGEYGLTNEQAAKEFEADAAGFIHLIDLEYKAITDVDKAYAKSIPVSLHAYYHVILYWYKIALLAQKHGTASQDQERLVQFVQGYGTSQIAAGAGAYLELLGDFQDATGVRHVLVTREPNQHGHFDQVTAATHSFYESLPAPAILLARVREDLRKTTDRLDDDAWLPPAIAPVVRQPLVRPSPEPRVRPPQRRRERQIAELGQEVRDPDLRASEEDLVPEEPPAPMNLPTVNLLGWNRPRTLTANQLSELKGALPDPDNIHLANRTYQVSQELFELVKRHIRELKVYKVTNVPQSTTGSMAQQATWRPCEPVLGRFQQFITSPGQIISRTVLPLPLAIAAKIMCYRAIRREFKDEDDDIEYNPWPCFDFDRYRDVPANWRANRNTRIERGMDGLITFAPFKTQVSSRVDTTVEYLNKFKLK